MGAYAFAFHAKPRATKDLDVYVDPTPANAKRLRAALRDFFGGTPPGYADADLLDPDNIIQLGVAPVRIDIIASLSGVDAFALAWRRREEGTLARHISATWFPPPLHAPRGGWRHTLGP